MSVCVPKTYSPIMPDMRTFLPNSLSYSVVRVHHYQQLAADGLHDSREPYIALQRGLTDRYIGEVRIFIAEVIRTQQFFLKKPSNSRISHLLLFSKSENLRTSVGDSSSCTGSFYRSRRRPNPLPPDPVYYYHPYLSDRLRIRCRR